MTPYHTLAPTRSMAACTRDLESKFCVCAACVADAAFIERICNSIQKTAASSLDNKFNLSTATS